MNCRLSLSVRVAAVKMFSEDLKKRICELEDCNICHGYMQKDNVKDIDGTIVGSHLTLLLSNASRVSSSDSPYQGLLACKGE